MPGRRLRLLGCRTGPFEITQGLGLFVRHVDRRQVTRPQTLSQFARITTIRLDPLPRLAGNQRGGNDLRLVTRLLQPSM